MADSKFGRVKKPLSPETLAQIAASAPAGLTAPMTALVSPAGAVDPAERKPAENAPAPAGAKPSYDLLPKRPPGRRRKPIPESEERHPFLVRLPVPFYQRLDQMANRDGMSINEIILRMIADGFRADDERQAGATS